MGQIAKVYLIDDSDIDNYFHQIVCEQTDVVAEMKCFTCPERALRYFAFSPIQEGEFLFLDINMPRMTGFQFLDQISTHPATVDRDPFVIIVSTSSNPDDAERAMRYEIVRDYHTKALTADYLIALSEHDTNSQINIAS